LKKESDKYSSSTSSSSKDGNEKTGKFNNKNNTTESNAANASNEYAIQILSKNIICKLPIKSSMETYIKMSLDSLLKLEKVNSKNSEILLQISQIYYEEMNMKLKSLDYLIKYYISEENILKNKGFLSIITLRYEELNEEDSDIFLRHLLELPNFNKDVLIDLFNNYITFDIHNIKHALKYEELGFEMSSRLYLDIAEIYQKTLKYHDAIKYYRLSYNSIPSSSVLLDMGFTYYKIGKKVESKEMFMEALKRNDLSKAEESLCNSFIGQIHFELLEYEQALHYAKLSEVKENKHPKLLYDLLGNIYFETNQYDEALKYYKLADAISGGSESTVKYTLKYLNRARIYLHQNNKAEADLMFKKYIKEHNDKAEAEYAAGYYYIDSSKHDYSKESFDHFMKVVQIDPNYKHVNLHLGQYHSNRNEDEIAIKYLLKSLEVDGPNFYVDYLLGTHYHNLFKFEESNKYFFNALEKDKQLDSKKLSFIYYYLSKNYFQLYNNDESIKYGLKVLEIEPENFSIHMIVAACYSSQKADDDEKLYQLKEKALEHFEKAVQINPDSTLAHIKLASVLNDIGRDEEAIEHLKISIELDPKLESSYLLLAYIMSSLNMKEEAIEYYKKCIEVEPNNHITHSNLSFLLREQGRNSEADEHYQISLSLMSKS